MRNSNYHVHEAKGNLVYDYGLGTKKFEPWWAMVFTDSGIIDYYAWYCNKKGISLQKGSSYGAHISFIRGEEPLKKENWGIGTGEISFYYAHTIRYDNNRHAWLDVWCDDLVKIREKLGLPPKPQKIINGVSTPNGYHLTIGRLS